MMTKDYAQGELARMPQPGEIYRHYKGGHYSVVTSAIKEDTLEPMVVYRSNARGSVWIRTHANFVELVDGVPRFSRLSE